MCNLYSITTNQEAIAALFRVVNRYVGNLAPMPGVFADYPAPVVRNTDTGRELTMMQWGMPPSPWPPVTNIRTTTSTKRIARRQHDRRDVKLRVTGARFVMPPTACAGA
jgi:putative SOS response-associated peptidase YedK